MNRTSFLCGNRNGHHHSKNVNTHNRTTRKIKTDEQYGPKINRG